MPRLFFLPQFLQTVQGYGPLGAGLRLLPWTATLLPGGPLAGALVNRSANARSCRRPAPASGRNGLDRLHRAPDVAYVKLVAR